MLGLNKPVGRSALGNDSFIVTTDALDGFRITEVIGFVCASSRAKLLGVEVKGLIDDTRMDLFNQALRSGGNAVVAFRISAIEYTIVCYGTAVRLEKL